MGLTGHTAHAPVTAFLQGSGARWREVADGEWGLVVDDVGGAPLEVGLRAADGLLRVQTWAVSPSSAVDPHLLLHRNRLGALARYAHSRAGDVHVHAEALLEGLTEAGVDRVVGAVVEAAEWVRAGAGGVPREASAPGRDPSGDH